MLDIDAEPPDTSHLTGIRDRIIEIIDAGTVPERKAMREALLAELRVDDNQIATPVIRIPLSRAETPSLLQADTRTAVRRAVRACPPSVEPRGLEPLTPTLPVRRK
jgi:site-specific DNA recombinase